MALAVLKLYKCTGTVGGGVHATETYVSTSRVAFLNTDTHSIDTTSYPIAVPEDVGSSPNYSYETWLKWVLDNTFGGYIQNIKLYGSSSAPATGCTVYWGVTATAATPNTNPTVNNVAIIRQDTNDYDTSNYLALTVDPGDGKLDTANDKTDFLVAIFRIDNTASGDVGTLTFNMSYEEVT